MRQAVGGLTSTEGGVGSQAPAAEADRPLTNSLPKLTPGDKVETFLEVFVAQRRFVGGRAPPSPAERGSTLHCAQLTSGRALIIPGASPCPGGQAETYTGGPQAMVSLGTRPFALVHQLLDIGWWAGGCSRERGVHSRW